MFFNDWDLVFFVESENKLNGLQKEDAIPAVFGGKHEDVSFFCSIILKNRVHRFVCICYHLLLYIAVQDFEFLETFSPERSTPLAPEHDPVI